MVLRINEMKVVPLPTLLVPGSNESEMIGFSPGGSRRQQTSLKLRCKEDFEELCICPAIGGGRPSSLKTVILGLALA